MLKTDRLYTRMQFFEKFLLRNRPRLKSCLIWSVELIIRKVPAFDASNWRASDFMILTFRLSIILISIYFYRIITASKIMAHFLHFYWSLLNEYYLRMDWARAFRIQSRAKNTAQRCWCVPWRNQKDLKEFSSFMLYFCISRKRHFVKRFLISKGK